MGKMSRGVLVGSALILILYSLLPETIRFSRAIILLGALFVWVWFTASRFLFKLIGLKDFYTANTIENKILVIGELDEFIRVKSILQATGKKLDSLYFLSVNEVNTNIPEYVGQSRQMEEVIKIYSVDEVIFCSRNISSSEIIDSMLKLVATGIDFKIAPPESLSIIGSNSIDTAGDLYVIDVNSITKPENKRKKRILDLLVSFVILISFPVLFWFQENKGEFLKNIFRVLFGKFSWVGYGDFNSSALPKIKSSILSPVDSLEGSAKLQNEMKQRLHLNYSKDYKTENDFRIIWKCLRMLGRKVK
jgi:hypothetical protein